MFSSVRKELAASVFETLHSKLTEFQLGIWEELEKKGSCGLSLPMGTGKTLLGLVSAMRHVSEWGTPALVQCENALASTWLGEMKKFSPGTEKHIQILGSSWKTNETLEIKEDTLIVVSAGHGARISYNDAGGFLGECIEDKFCLKVGAFQKSVEYNIPQKPYREYPCLGNLVIHAVHWSVMIVDESQKYYNIAIPRSLARGICSVCARTVIALSGTMLAEPKTPLLFGFATLTRQDIPRTLPLFKSLMCRKQLRPVSEMCVIREQNEDASNLELEYEVVAKSLSVHEQVLYDIMLGALDETAKKLDLVTDSLLKKELNTRLLVLIGYMRQLLLSSSLCLDSMIKSKDTCLAGLGDLTKIIDMWDKWEGIGEYKAGYKAGLESRDAEDIITTCHEERVERCVVGLKEQRTSTRIEALGELLGKMKTRCIVFSSFNVQAKEVTKYLEQRYPGRCYLFVDGKMSQTKRDRNISIFEAVDDAVMFLSYKLGACGHNFQYCNKVIFMDMDWNASWEKQALARCLRRGQKLKVSAFELISNTPFEKIMAGKHKSKDILGGEYIKQGYGKEIIPTLSLRNMVKKLRKEELSQTHNTLLEIRQGNRPKPVIVEDLTGDDSDDLQEQLPTREIMDLGV